MAERSGGASILSMMGAYGRVGLGMLLAGGACGDRPPNPEPLGIAVDDASSFAGGPRYADGTTIERVRVVPEPLDPGASFTLEIEVTGPGGAGQLGVRPPRDIGRQVARGGVDAPPVQVPEDPRARVVPIELTPGTTTHTFALPEPWHPATAVLTLELGPTDDPIPAVAGPRTEGRVAPAVGILAVLPVLREPTMVDALRVDAPPRIDGVLDDAAWAGATFFELVDSLAGERVERGLTEVAVVWTETDLVLGARLHDEDVWSTYERDDDPLWKEEVLELFLFGDGTRRNYLELQVSPRGHRFDARFEHYRQGDEAFDGPWRAAVSVDGTLDDRNDVDRGWTAELAVPWTMICTHTAVVCPPTSTTRLRMNVFRLERPSKGATLGTALSPPVVPDFHAPENAAVLRLGPPP